MALTETLNNVNPSDRIVQPGPASGGFISGLSRLASQAVTSIAQDAQRQEAKAGAAALNDAAQGVQDRFNTADANLNDDDINLNVPNDVRDAMLQGKKAQKATAQGTMSMSASELHLESLVDDLYRKHPEKKAMIAQYFQSQGLDHYLFRDVKATIAATQSAEALEQANEDALIKKGVAAGLVSPDAPRATQIAVGSKVAQDEYRLEVSSKQLNLAKLSGEVSEQERKRLETDGNNGIVKALIDDADRRVGVVTQGFAALTIAAATDPEKHKQLKEAIPTLVTGIETAKLAAVAQATKAGADAAAVTRIKDYYDMQGAALKAQFTGDLARDAIQVGILQQMQTQFGIEAAQAAPLWMQLSKLPGMANALPLLFGGDPAHAMSPEQQKAVAAELSGLNFGSTEGLYRVQRVADVLRGELSLTRMSLPEAQETIKGVNTAVVGGGQAIMRGDMTQATVKPFLTGLENLTDAAWTTATPNAAPKSQLRAAQILGNLDTIRGLVAAVKDPNHRDEAVQVLVSVRGTAQKGIIAAKSGDWEHGRPGSLQKLVWDPKREQVVRVIDEDRYRAYLAATTKQNKSNQGLSARQLDTNAQTTRPMTREDIMRHPDGDLETRAGTINNYLTTMVATYTSDPNTPAGFTPKQAREAAFKGVPLERLQPKGAEGQSFDQQLNSLVKSAQDITFNTIANSTTDRQTTDNEKTFKPVAFSAADKYNVPRGAVEFLFGQEAGWNPNIGGTQIDNNGDGKPDSSARGIGQFIEGTAKDYGLMGEGFDHRDDPYKSIDAATRYLADLGKSTGGDWLKALHRYGVLDRRNFKTEEQYNNAVNRAKQFLGQG